MYVCSQHTKTLQDQYLTPLCIYWSNGASTTHITKLQTIQDIALCIATGCILDTNIQHLHDEINVLPLYTHLKLHNIPHTHSTNHTTPRQKEQN